ncbi:MAG TPA: PIG-L family deacetylase [Longimicrobiales bacterium]
MTTAMEPERGVPGRDRTLLVALAHPDDEVGCAGTIAAHRARGDRVVLVWLTRGEMTDAFGRLGREEVARRRTEHGAQVGRMLGCEVRFLDFPDTRVEATADAAHRMARLVAEVKPDAVVTWGEAWVRGMRHPDHQATGKIVRDAVMLARISAVVAPAAPHRADVPVFTLREPPSLLPERAVDVSAHVEQVLEVARFYRERVGWPEEEWLLARLREAGKRWGVQAAESFDAWETPGGLGPALV